mgnify:FL=1
MRGRICGTGSYIPEHYYDNNDLAKFVETNDEWIRERTGIVRRHIAEEDTTVSMAIKAAKNALTDAKLNADDLDLILVIYNHAKHRDPKHCLRSPERAGSSKCNLFRHQCRMQRFCVCLQYCAGLHSSRNVSEHSGDRK